MGRSRRLLERGPVTGSHCPAATGLLIWPIFLSLAAIVFPLEAFADLTGYMDLTYSNALLRSEPAQGDAVDLHTHSLVQRYSLTFDRRIFPNVRLLASGLFEHDAVTSRINGQESEQTITTVSPYIQLSIEDPMYKGAFGYSRRDRNTETSTSPDQRLVRDEWLFNLNWYPVGYPSVQIQGAKSRSFDRDRSFLDLGEDFLSLKSEYRSGGLYIRYYGTYSDQKNRIERIETKAFSHTAEMSYERAFLGDRITLSADYQVTLRSLEISGSGTGDVLFQAFPFSGLSGQDDTPLEGALDQNNLLIDGNLAAGAGIDLGRSASTGGIQKVWNIALDFFADAEVDTIYVWVDRELPASVSGAFSWKVYVSRDNLLWTLADTAPAAAFGILQNRFEIRFSAVTTRYVKVVTESLASTFVPPAGTDVNNIIVTEVQAFRSRPAESGRQKVSDQSHRINIAGRAQILGTPLLYYDLSYLAFHTGSRAGSAAVTNWSLINSLNLSHQFSRVLTLTGRVLREDGHSPEGETTAYGYTASLAAVPLRTLTHTFTLSGRSEDNPGGHLTRNGAFLYNTAELYTGLNVSVSVGMVFSTLETGQEERSPSFNLGVEIMPRSNLSIQALYSSAETTRTGGGEPDMKTFTRRGDVSVSYYPVRSLYLLASIGRVSQETKSFTLHSYSVNWAPFPGGALQISMNYDENVTSDRNEKSRLFSPHIRWNFRRRSWLDLSYLVIKQDSDVERSNQKVFSMNLRIGF